MIVLVAIVVAIFSIISGMFAADGSPIAAALTLMPLFLAGLCLMKEKVWYLWFLLPPLVAFLPHGEFSSFLIYCGTLPFYIWHVVTNRASVTWNKAPMLDVAVFLIIAYVGWLFIEHPFALGIDIMQDYYGGKGYVLFLQALVVYLCLSSLKTDSGTLGKILQWTIAISVFSSLISTVRGLLNPETIVMEEGPGGEMGEASRVMVFANISTLVLNLIIINFSIKDLFKKPWWIVVAGVACVGIMVSGFRNVIANVVILFAAVSLLYKRWFALLGLPALALGVLTVMSSQGLLHKMPYGVQRVCSVVPFLDVDPAIRRAAEGSTDWRVEMWRWALDDRENFIKDKVWGDGFAKPMSDLLASTYQKAYGLTQGNQEEFARGGVWHSGPISTIQVMGYVGFSLYLILALIAMIYGWMVSKIYLYHPHRLGILYISVNVILSPITFIFLFGDSTYIAGYIMNVAVIKLLYNCAKREGRYEPLSIRKEYVPLMIRQRETEPVS